MQLKMADPEFYQQETQLIAKANQELANEESVLSQLYSRWEILEDVEKRNK